MMNLIDLNQKHILFDSCVVGELFKSSGALKELIELLENNECVLCINDFIKLEFMRIAKNEVEYDKLERFLAKYFFKLPTTPDIYEIAFRLASIYNLCHTEKNQISITDCFNGVFLSKYFKNLLLITFDLYDYPIEIFNRIHVGASDIGKKVITWGIYDFDVKKYEGRIKIFNK